MCNNTPWLYTTKHRTLQPIAPFQSTHSVSRTYAQTNAVGSWYVSPGGRGQHRDRKPLLVWRILKEVLACLKVPQLWVVLWKWEAGGSNMYSDWIGRSYSRGSPITSTSLSAESCFWWSRLDNKGLLKRGILIIGWYWRFFRCMNRKIACCTAGITVLRTSPLVVWVLTWRCSACH